MNGGGEDDTDALIAAARAAHGGGDDTDALIAQARAKAPSPRAGKTPAQVRGFEFSQPDKPEPDLATRFGAQVGRVGTQIGEGAGDVLAGLKALILHPVESGKAIARGTAQTVQDATAPVLGETTSAARAVGGKGGRFPGIGTLNAGETITRENTPGAVTPETQGKAGANIAIAAALPGLLKGAGMLRTVGTLGTVGAASNPDEPVRGFVAGAGTGALLSAGIPAAGRAATVLRNMAPRVSQATVDAGGVLGNLAKLTGATREQAAANFAAPRIFAGMSPAQVEANIARAQGTPSVLGDTHITGAPGTAMLETAATIPNAETQNIAQTLGERGRAQFERQRGNLRDLTGSSGQGRLANLDAINDAAVTEAAPLYAQVDAHGPLKTDAALNAVRTVLNAPGKIGSHFKNALGIGQELQAAEELAAAVKEGRTPQAATANFTPEMAMKLANIPEGERLAALRAMQSGADAVPSLRDVDAMKKGLDVLIRTGGESGRPLDRAMAAQLRDILNGVLEHVDVEAPVYKQARRVYAGKYALEDASQLGAEHVGKTSEAVQRALESLPTQAEKDAFLLHHTERQVEKIGNVPRGTNIARSAAFDSPNAEQTAQVVAKSPDAASRFADRQWAEQGMAQTEAQALKNSRTAPRSELMQDLKTEVSPPAKSLLNPVRYLKAVRDLADRQQMKQIAGELGKLGLTPTSDPEAIATVLNRLKETAAASQKAAALRQRALPALALQRPDGSR